MREDVSNQFNLSFTHALILTFPQKKEQIWASI